MERKKSGAGEEKPRRAELTRKTKETEITVALELGRRRAEISTGVGFFDHLLSALSFHGRLGLKVQGSGDIEVDYHHLVEDVGIVLGEALRLAIGSEPAVERFGSAAVPMDEALVLAAVDISGRGGAFVDGALCTGAVRDFDASLVKEFLIGFARSAGITLHVRLLCDGNTHHKLEAACKALGRALWTALAPTPEGGSSSTKGTTRPAG